MKIVIVDDDRLAVLSLKTIVEAQDIEVVGAGYSGSEAVALYDALKPDILLMDIRMDGLSGLDAAPEMGSLNMGSIVFFTGKEKAELLFMNHRSEIEAFAAEMLKRGIKPEMEVYNPSMFGEIENLMAKNLLAKPYYINCVMGVDGMGGYKGSPKNLITMIEHLPEGSVFNVTGIGRWQMGMNVMAILTGGHARVGLEDNVYFRKGEPASGNAQFVERLVKISREIGRDIATPDEALIIYCKETEP